MRIISLAFLLSFFVLSCSFLSVNQKLSSVCVANFTGRPVTKLMLFSQKFDNLSNDESSAVKSFDFVLEKHDPIIQFEIEGIKFAQYLPPPENGFQKYIIDNVDLKKKTFRIQIKSE